MANQEPLLYETTVVKWFGKGYRVYACIYFVAILGLTYYRIAFLPTHGRTVPWLLLFGAELLSAYIWILDQAFPWSPIDRQTFPQRLWLGFERDLPSVDIFICTADPIKVPPLTVVNTVLSTLAFDYPVEKLACYLSDDGGSPLTFYALVEASRFAKTWVPFCKKHSIEQRCVLLSSGHRRYVALHLRIENMKKSYEVTKDRINNAAEKGAIPEDIKKEHDGFKEWSTAEISRSDHPSIVQILLENGKDMDLEGVNCPPSFTLRVLAVCAAGDIGDDKLDISFGWCSALPLAT